MSLTSFQSRRQDVKGSMEQFYTNLDMIQQAVATLSQYCAPSTPLPIVDFSCGSNEFVKLCRRQGLGKRSLSVDISPPSVCHKPKTILTKDWLSITSIDPQYHHGILGFNPPFGHRGRLSKQFIRHGIQICNPRWMVFILPYSAKKCDYEGYGLLYSTLLPPNAFHRLQNSGQHTPFHFNAFLCIYVRNTEPMYRKRICTPIYPKPKMISNIISAYKKIAELTPNSNYIILRRIGNNAGRNGYLVVKGAARWIEFRLGKLLDQAPVRPVQPSVNYTHMAIEIVPSYTVSGLQRLISKLSDYRLRTNKEKNGFNVQDVYCALA